MYARVRLCVHIKCQAPKAAAVETKYKVMMNLMRTLKDGGTGEESYKQIGVKCVILM